MNGRKFLALSCLLLMCGCATDVPARWFSSKADDQPILIQPLEIGVAPPSAEQPVTAGLYCQPVAGSLEELDVWIKARIADGFYLHAPDADHPEMIPISVSLELGDRAQMIEQFEFSDFIRDDQGYAIYEEDVLLRARIRVPETGSEKILVKASLRYQVCSETSCQPPAELKLSQEVAVP